MAQKNAYLQLLVIQINLLNLMRLTIYVMILVLKFLEEITYMKKELYVIKKLILVILQMTVNIILKKMMALL